MRTCFAALLVLASVLTLTDSAAAADVWTDPAPGVRQLVRTAPGPVRYIAVTVDLERSDLYIRATRPEEAFRTPTAWANQVDAVVAINGDWIDFDNNRPVGLAVGDGVYWEGTADVGWSFIACTLEKECVFDDHATNTPRYHRWYNVVGGNGWRLLTDGQTPNYPNENFYRSDRHPRSGVGLSADGNTMILAVAEGRLGDSIGVSFVTFSQFFKDLGAHNAMMLDGGGSSAIVVNGARQNRLPGGQSSERSLVNHLGIVRGASSPECAQVSNGRYCEGNTIHTCKGGQYFGAGDCAAFGATCEETPDGIGTCVHPDCTNGANGAVCDDDTFIRRCDYGQPGDPGDCSAFGATCEVGEDTAYCVNFMCSEGGNATWCSSDEILSSCVEGQPQPDVNCAAQALVCKDGACQSADESALPDVGIADEVDMGLAPSDTEADSGATNMGADTGTAVIDPTVSSGCATGGKGAPTPLWLALLIGIALLRSRGRHSTHW